MLHPQARKGGRMTVGNSEHLLIYLMPKPSGQKYSQPAVIRMLSLHSKHLNASYRDEWSECLYEAPS